ncbi:MAG TPA: U32 family peptidase, partial [Noviherbaspirillum sp.]
MIPRQEGGSAVELVRPAGSLPPLKAAIDHDADSVYL